MNSSLYKMAFFSIILFLISSSASAAMEREAVGGNKTDTILTRPNASQVVYISPTKDAYGESCPANTATGNQFNIYLGYDTWYGKCRTRPFFHFSLSSIPVGSTIDSAQLEIYQYAVETTSSYGVVAYPITQNWDEYILTWNNQPSVGNAIGWSTFSTGLGWKYIGLTTLARNWYSGVTNNYGVALRRGTNEYYKGGIFYSRNCSSSQCSSGQRPRLKVVYTPPATYFVSGQVIDNQGVAMSDVTISDNAGHTTATDGNGNYQLNGLLAGDYTLTPSKSDYIFSPTSKMISVSSNVSEQNFVGTLTVFMVSGKVTDNYDNPVVDVIISDGVGHTTVTDINGNYNISGLSGGTYTLTPSRAQFTFTPNNRIVALSDVNIVGQNFTMIMGCEDRSAVDVVLTLDKSGSMDGTPLTTAKNDSKYFIDLLSLSADQVGLA